MAGSGNQLDHQLTMAAKNKLMRDVLIEEVFRQAQRNRNILFMSADLGAQALDDFREKLPAQFVYPGICEQNMIDVAAGLAKSGKTVFTYAMASFITARCFEQLKCSLAAMQQPVTVISVGVGLGYDDAGPTHYTTEDIACMRTLSGIEIWTPSDEESTLEITRLCCERPALRYLRLERPALPAIYQGTFADNLEAGFCEISTGQDVCIVSSGYMLHRALQVQQELQKAGVDAGVVDLFRIKPLNSAALLATLNGYSKIVTLEEQVLAGGFGSAICEVLMDEDAQLPVLRLGLPDRYFFENGGRNHVLEKYGLGVPQLTERIREFVRKPVPFSDSDSLERSTVVAL